ncbi:MAG: radical SAM family heme chaperone HemW [Pseudomonadaceae bacterium]|nr:radical SAM family heme chaperone HemW [Pseudomonadaceae bacterium]
MTNIPLSLYVHFPWCVRKCPYCDFNSHPAPETDDGIPEDAYRERLLADLEAAFGSATRPIHSVFFGGGTPSLFSAETFAALMDVIAPRLEADAEVTMEVNPGAREYNDFAAYRHTGINRLSIGAQSFNDDSLKRLGRIHGAKEIGCCVDAARTGGFDNINLDVMHGLPQQSAHMARQDLSEAIALQPEHISWYQLTLEPKTEFGHRPPTLPAEDTLADIEDAGLDMLVSAGYQRYEVSAFAKPGRAGRHNLNYWQFGDYLGVGAGAHGKLTVDDGSIERTTVVSQPRLYLAGLSPLACAPIAESDLAAEFMMNALRLIDGVTWESFTERTGLSSETIQKTCDQLIDAGLLRENRLAPTPAGLRWLDTVIASFL